MRAVIQRVKEARVEVSGRTVGAIGHGLLILLGIAYFLVFGLIAEYCTRDVTVMFYKSANHCVWTTTP